MGSDIHEKYSYIPLSTLVLTVKCSQGMILIQFSLESIKTLIVHDGIITLYIRIRNLIIPKMPRSISEMKLWDIVACCVLLVD